MLNNPYLDQIVKEQVASLQPLEKRQCVVSLRYSVARYVHARVFDADLCAQLVDVVVDAVYATLLAKIDANRRSVADITPVDFFAILFVWIALV